MVNNMVIIYGVTHAFTFWRHIGRKFQMKSLLKVHIRPTPKNSCTLLQRGSRPKLCKRFVTFKFWIFANLFFYLFIYLFCLFFFVSIWENMGRSFNDLSFESTHRIISAKSMHTPGEYFMYTLGRVSTKVFFFFLNAKLEMFTFIIW